MLYLAYQTHTDIMVPVRIFAEAGLNALSHLGPPRTTSKSCATSPPPTS